VEDNLKKKKMKKEDLKKYKNLFLLPLKFRGKHFLGLAQLSKIFLQFIELTMKSKINSIFLNAFVFCSAWSKSKSEAEILVWTKANTKLAVYQPLNLRVNCVTARHNSIVLRYI
jgi:hypothetical protein